MKAGLPQDALLRPFRKSYFRHEFWFDPMRSLRVEADGRIHERRFRLLEGARVRWSFFNRLSENPVPTFPAYRKRPVLVKADQQCAKSMPRAGRLRESADDEFLPLLAFHFEPTASRPDRYAGVHPFNDQSL